MLIEMTGKEQAGGRKEGLAGVWVAGGAGSQCSPVGSGQGTGFLVNSAASSKNTSALDRGHRAPRVSSRTSPGTSASFPKGQGIGKKFDL